MPLSFAEIAAGLTELPAPPVDRGTVALVVVRPERGTREHPSRARLTPADGVEGDRWARGPQPNPQNQITLMRADFHRLIGPDLPLSTAGDNLMVELDLSEENLPAGSLLQIGSAVCTVTPLPHTGCGQFSRRFGQDARDVTNAPEYRALRLRGIHVCVLEEGAVSPGDEVAVLRRGPA